MKNKDSYTAEGPSLVSIALCTYNGGAFLQEQLDSLLQQSYTNIEIIAVDDASTDGTRSILEKNASADNRLKVFINEKNIGYNKNFEKAIGLCSGKYIAISDQDDIWDIEKIGKMMRLWPEGAQFIYSLSGSFTGTHFENRTAAPNVVYTPIDHVLKLVFNSPVHGHACMFKKELVPLCTPFPANIFYDWWMSMHAAAFGTIGCIPETLTWHRVHENNSSRNITSISDKEERNEQLRQQCVYFYETFCNKDILTGSQKKLLEEYAAILKKMNGKKFSWPMFIYVLKNRKLIFHYKKQKPFLFFSYMKHAYKMAYKGLL